MQQKRKEILDKILSERERQLNLPGSEWDARREPNDWLSTVIHYASRNCSRIGNIPKKEEFEDSLVKAAAVILAALEHSENMTDDKKLTKK